MIDFLSENIGFRRDLHPAVLAGVAIMVARFHIFGYLPMYTGILRSPGALD